MADLQPGDPGFNWATYIDYHAAHDPVADAKETLDRSQQLADSSGLSQVEAHLPTTTAPQSSADIAGNFLKNAWSGSAINPSNWLHGLKALVPGTDENQQAQLQMLDDAQHPIASSIKQMFPLTGGAGFKAGEQLGSGDISGGLGTLTADVTNAALPMVIPEIPGAIRTATDATGRGIGALGRGMEAVGASAPARSGGNLATLNAIVRPSWGSVATATIPPALEYGGRGLQRLGNAIRSLAGDTSTSMERLAPNVSGYGGASWSDQAVGTPYEGPSGSVPNVSGYNPADRGSIQALGHGGQSSVTGNETPSSQYRAPFTSGDPAAARFTGPTSPDDLADNLNGNAPFGEGHIIPGPMPSEYAQTPVAQTFDQSASGIYPTVHVPDFTYEAGRADVPGITINGQQFPTPPPSLARLQRATQSLGRDSSIPDAPAPTRKPIDVDQSFGDLEVNHLAKQTGRTPAEIRAQLAFAKMMQAKGAQLGSPTVHP